MTLLSKYNFRKSVLVYMLVAVGMLLTVLISVLHKAYVIALLVWVLFGVWIILGISLYIAPVYEEIAMENVRTDVLMDVRETIKLHKQKMDGNGYYLAIDPGMTNLAVWTGTVSKANGLPQTTHLTKFDLGDKTKKALYESAVDLVLTTDWMSDSSRIIQAVVETQAPRNIPARVVATAIYGALRGRGIKTTFSGSSLKNKAMDILSKRVGFEMEKKPSKLGKDASDKERAARRRMMYRTNKTNSVALVRRMLDAVGDFDTKAVMDGAKKADDMADAMLLGVGLCVVSPPCKKKTTSQHTIRH